MKRLNLLLLLVIMCVATPIFAQNKIFVSASCVAETATNDLGSFAVGLTAGYYVANDIRVDIDCYYWLQRLNWGTAALSLTLESPLSLNERLVNYSSLGIGVMSSLNDKTTQFTEVIIPMKYGICYKLTDWLSLGLESSYKFNLNNFKNRSLFSYGATLAFRF